MENYIGYTIYKSEYNVMTMTSRCGSIHETFVVLEDLGDGKYKCEKTNSSEWGRFTGPSEGEKVYTTLSLRDIKIAIAEGSYEESSKNTKDS